MKTNPEPTPQPDSKKSTIIPSAVFAGHDMGWQIWTDFVKQLDWATPEGAEKAITASFYRAADQLIDKERALSFVYAWLHNTDFGMTDKQLRAKANAAYRNIKKKRNLEAAGKDASPEAVKSEDLLASLRKREWTPETMSENLGKAIRYSRRLKLSPDVAQKVIESFLSSIGLVFDPDELRKRFAQEP